MDSTAAAAAAAAPAAAAAAPAPAAGEAIAPETTPTSLEDLADALAALKKDHAVFKKENKGIFTENREFNKAIKQAKAELLAIMKERNELKIAHNGVEFEIKEKQVAKHNMDVLKELLESGDGLPDPIDTYLQQVNTDHVDIVTRRAKRARSDE